MCPTLYLANIFKNTPHTLYVNSNWENNGSKDDLIPILTHLFISLPSPKNDFIKQLNDILLEYVWEG